MLHRRTWCILAPLLLASLSLADERGDDLLAAARKGDTMKLKQLLNEGVDVNSKSSYGQTALFFACDRGHTEIVKLLLEHGADVNTKDTFYNATALTWAASKDRLDIVKLLLDKGAEGVDMVLSSAVQSGKVPMIQLALDTGKVKPNTLTYALSVATKAKKDDIAAMLVKAGAKPPAPANATVPAETLALYAGKYQGGRGGTETELTVAIENGKLVIRAGTNSLNLVAVSNTRFRNAANEQMEIEFKVQDGKAVAMDIIQGGNAMPFKRMEAK